MKRRRRIARVLRLVTLTRIVLPHAAGLASVYARTYRRAWQGPWGQV